MQIKIIGENLIGLKEGEEITVREIYDRLCRYYKICDAKEVLDQCPSEELLIDENNEYISNEEYQILCEDVADMAAKTLEKSDSYYDAYWAAFDMAIDEIKRRKTQISMF